AKRLHNGAGVVGDVRPQLAKPRSGRPASTPPASTFLFMREAPSQRRGGRLRRTASARKASLRPSGVDSPRLHLFVHARSAFTAARGSSATYGLSSQSLAPAVRRRLPPPPPFCSCAKRLHSG